VRLRELCCCARELEQQLEDAVALAEAAARQRCEAEGRAAAAEARAEAAFAQCTGSRSLDDRDLELRNLREELAAQEATIRKAQRLTDNIRCSRCPEILHDRDDAACRTSNMVILACMLIWWPRKPPSGRLGS
jgi:hypothetical protein